VVLQVMLEGSRGHTHTINEEELETLTSMSGDFVQVCGGAAVVHCRRRPS